MGHPEFKDYYDVIVIGAGVGGLTAAALLSKAGSVGLCSGKRTPCGWIPGWLQEKAFYF